MTSKYEVKSTKCQILNSQRDLWKSHTTSEVLLRLRDSTPIDIICPYYLFGGDFEEGVCIKRGKDRECIYKVGWKSLVKFG